MSEPTTTDGFLAEALAEEREIMSEYAREYRRWTMTGGLVYQLERSAFVAWALEVLRDAGQDPTTLRFLDVGCGTGEVLEELQNAGCRRLSGIDLCEAMIAETRRHVPDANLITGALENPTVEPGSMDVVMAAFTIHHLVDPRTFFRFAERVLAPGGWIFALEYNSGGWAYSGWTRFAARLLVAPLRFAVRWKNRNEIAAQPKLVGKFNRAHQLLDLAAIGQMAEAHGFTCNFETRGLLAPWFLHDTFETSRFDRRLLEVLGRIDEACPRPARSFQWVAGRRAVHPAIPSKS